MTDRDEGKPTLLDRGMVPVILGGDDSIPIPVLAAAPHNIASATSDFSNVQISAAGEVRRPQVDVAPEDIHDLAYSIIRVLNREGEAVGPWAGLLSDEEHVDPLLPTTERP
jgi:hypothetical protein